tara:strand:- start:451 stop:1866 length:1416 start_codon:yes stop_codon:yes gene_type:complete
LAKVLFFGAGATHRGVKAWLPVAVELRRFGVAPEFVLDSSCEKVWLDRLQGEEIEFYDLEKDYQSQVFNTTLMRKICGYALAKLQKIKIVNTWLIVRRLFKQSCWVLRDRRPQLVVLMTGTTLLGISVTRAAQRQGVPVILLPLAINSPPNSKAMHRVETARSLAVSEMTGFLRAVPWLRNRFGLEYYGYYIAFYPIELAWVLFCHGVLPRNGFSHANGGEKIIGCANTMDRARLMEEGVKREKITITGWTHWDRLGEKLSNKKHLKAEFFRAHSIHSNAKLVTVNPPILGHYGIIDMQRQADYVETIFKQINAVNGCQIVCSIHPHKDRSRIYAQYSRLFGQYNVISAENYDIEDLITFSDLYITEITSTLSSAIGCEIPTILIVYTDYMANQVIATRYFADQKSRLENDFIAVVDGLDNIKPEIRRWCGNDGHTSQAIESHKKDRLKKEWISLDEQCIERTAALIMKEI